jgi:hypothetical protein
VSVAAPSALISRPPVLVGEVLERSSDAVRLPTAEDFTRRVPGHHYSLGTIGWYLELVLSAPCSQRAASVVLGWMTQLWPGFGETPCANAGRTWLFRLGLYELTCPKEAGDDWVWLVDHTVQLGSRKGLIIVGLRLGAWQHNPRPLEHQDVRLLHLEPMEHSDGEAVKKELDKVAVKHGVPRSIVSDWGSDVKKGIRLFHEDHPAVACVHDIKHKVALLLKKELERDSSWEDFVSAANVARRGVTLTTAAFLVPPALKAKARYMNLDRLVAWGGKVLAYLDQPCEVPDCPVEAKLVKARLGWLRKYRQRIAQWSALMAVAEAGENYVRHQGLHAAAAEELRTRLEPLATCPPSRRLKAALLEFVTEQAVAAQPGERLIGSTEVLESIIGKYKRLQGMHSGDGMTRMILSIGALVGRRCTETLHKALTHISNSDLATWCRTHLGITLQACRKLAFAPEQNPPPTPPALIPRF